MKVVLTGATGFVGEHILAELEKRNIIPTLLIRPTSIAFLPKSQHSIIAVDITDLPNCNLFELIGKPDTLIHCAWSGLPNYQSLHHFEVELTAQYHFISRLIKDGLRNLLITGTCFEYGMCSGALSESIVCQPTNPYGFAKNSLLQKLKYLQRSHPFNLIWARLFYLYGHGQTKNALFSQLKQAVQHGDPIFNMSGGEQLRDYLPISTAANYLVSLAALRQNIDVVNVCSGAPTSIRSLVERWINENNWNIKLNLGHYAYPDYEPMAFWGDNTRLTAILKG